MYIPKKIWLIFCNVFNVTSEYLIMNPNLFSVSHTLQVYLLLVTSIVLLLLLKCIPLKKINQPAVEKPIYNKIIRFLKLIKKHCFKYRLVILLASLVTLFLLIEPTVYLISYLGYLTVLLIFLCKVVKILKYQGDRLKFDWLNFNFLVLMSAICVGISQEFIVYTVVCLILLNFIFRNSVIRISFSIKYLYIFLVILAFVSLSSILYIFWSDIWLYMYTIKIFIVVKWSVLSFLSPIILIMLMNGHSFIMHIYALCLINLWNNKEKCFIKLVSFFILNMILWGLLPINWSFYIFMLHTLCMAICSNIIDCKYDKTPFFSIENLEKVIITFLSFIIFRCTLSLSLPLVNELIVFFPDQEKDLHSKYIGSMSKAITCHQVVFKLVSPSDREEFLSLNKQQLSIPELEQACAVFVQGIPVKSFSLSEAEFQNCIFNGDVKYSDKVYTKSRGHNNVGIFRQTCESYRFNENTIPFLIEQAAAKNLNINTTRTQIIDFVVMQNLQKTGLKEIQGMADFILSKMAPCQPDEIMNDACQSCDLPRRFITDFIRCAYTDNQTETPYHVARGLFFSRPVSEAIWTIGVIKENFNNLFQILEHTEHNFEIANRHFKLLENNKYTKLHNNSVETVLTRNTAILFRVAVSEYLNGEVRARYFGAFASVY